MGILADIHRVVSVHLRRRGLRPFSKAYLPWSFISRLHWRPWRTGPRARYAPRNRLLGRSDPPPLYGRVSPSPFASWSSSFGLNLSDGCGGDLPQTQPYSAPSGSSLTPVWPGWSSPHPRLGRPPSDRHPSNILLLSQGRMAGSSDAEQPFPGRGGPFSPSICRPPQQYLLWAWHLLSEVLPFEDPQGCSSRALPSLDPTLPGTCSQL